MRCTLMNIAAFLAMTLFMASCFADDAPVQTDVAPAIENSEQSVDSTTQLPEEGQEEETKTIESETGAVNSQTYPVPENGTPAEYLAFIEKLMLIKRPADQSREEMIDHYIKLSKAQIAAADKVIEHKDATLDQMLRCVAVKIRCLQILIKAGDKDARNQLYSIPAQVEKAGQPQIADEIAMSLINLAIQEAKATNDFSEIEKIIEQTDQTIKKTPAEDKEKLQRLYLVKLICIKGLGQLKKVDNSADFEAVVNEMKEAGLSEMVEDIFMGKLASELSESVAQNDKAKFDKTAKDVDDMIADYGDKANLKVAAIAFQTAFTEEVFDVASAAARYEKYAAGFEKIEDAKVQEIVKTMRGAARRLTIKGKELPLAGKTIDGKDFNMANLKDKTVLVYFWSPTIPPSLDEFQYLKLAYPSYKDKGFEIVCIALDQDKKQVASFVKKYNFPWINLWEKDALIGDVCISEYFGIVALPCMFMVGPDGKVFSIDARNEALIETLTDKFGELTVTEEDIEDDDVDDDDIDDIDDEDDEDDEVNNEDDEDVDIDDDDVNIEDDEDVDIDDDDVNIEDEEDVDIDDDEDNLDIEDDDVNIEDDEDVDIDDDEDNLDIEDDDVNIEDDDEDIDIDDEDDVDEDVDDFDVEEGDVDIQDDDVDF